MQKSAMKRQALSFFLFLLIFGSALCISFLLARVDNDNNPFAMAVFLLAVALVARVTRGYFWGIAASVAGTFCVNYFFSYPFWAFDVTYPGYPLTMIVMPMRKVQLRYGCRLHPLKNAQPFQWKMTEKEFQMRCCPIS